MELLDKHLQFYQKNLHVTFACFQNLMRIQCQHVVLKVFIHPILSIVGAIEVAEAVKIIIGKKPNLSSERILHIDLENLDFNSTRTFRAEECPICGTGKLEVIGKRRTNFRRIMWT